MEAVEVQCILFLEFYTKIKICIPKSSSEKLLITDWIYSDYQSKYVREAIILINSILHSAAKEGKDYYLHAIRQEMDLVSSNDFHAGIELKKGTDSKQILDQIFEEHPEYLEKIIKSCRIKNLISYKNVYPRVEAEEFWRHVAEDEGIMKFLNEQGITDIAIINKWISEEKESRIRESQKNFYKTSMSDLDMREYMNILLNNPSSLKK